MCQSTCLAAHSRSLGIERGGKGGYWWTSVQAGESPWPRHVSSPKTVGGQFPGFFGWGGIEKGVGGRIMISVTDEGQVEQQCFGRVG